MPLPALSLGLVGFLSVFFLSIQLNPVLGTAKGPSVASKKCQQYGHSCLGGHGKRSSPADSGQMMAPFISSWSGPTQLAPRYKSTGGISSGEVVSTTLERTPTLGQLFRMPLSASLASLPKSRQWNSLKSVLDSLGAVGSLANDVVFESEVNPMAIAAPVGTDPDGDLRQRTLILSSLLGNSGHQLPVLPGKKLSGSGGNQQTAQTRPFKAPISASDLAEDIATSSQQQWDMMSPRMRALATGESFRFRRSVGPMAKARRVRGSKLQQQEQQQAPPVAH